MEEATISIIKNFKAKNIVYKVQSGDTLSSIARKFTTTPQILSEVNKTSEVALGDRVYIPCVNTAVYVVKPLDTISSVASRFNISTEKLKKQNGNIEFLYIGQMLII